MSLERAKKTLLLSAIGLTVMIIHAAWAPAEDLSGEIYVFRAGEKLSNVLWAKMASRHLQERHVRLYGSKGLLKLTQSLNPSISNLQDVPPGSKLVMPRIDEAGLAINDLSPGKPKKRSKHAPLPRLEQDDQEPQRSVASTHAGSVDPAPAEGNGAEPETVANVRPPAPAARLLSPVESSAPAAPEAHEADSGSYSFRWGSWKVSE